MILRKGLFTFLLLIFIVVYGSGQNDKTRPVKIFMCTDFVSSLIKIEQVLF